MNPIQDSTDPKKTSYQPLPCYSTFTIINTPTVCKDGPENNTKSAIVTVKIQVV